MVNHTIVDEIIALGPLRIQKVFGLFGHVLVLELFSKQHRRLYLVFDVNRTTKTFHVQKERPLGAKSTSPFTALLTKYGVSQQIRFFKLDQEGLLIKAVFSHSDDDSELIFEIESSFKVGLFVHQTLRATLPEQESIPFRAGFLVGTTGIASIDANLLRAPVYQHALMTFHHEALLATERAHLKHDLTKKKALLKNVVGDLARCEQSLLLEDDANLLKSQMHLIKRGMKEVQVMDYTRDPPAHRSIALDPRLTPQAFLTRRSIRSKKQSAASR